MCGVWEHLHEKYDVWESVSEKSSKVAMGVETSDFSVCPLWLQKICMLHFSHYLNIVIPANMPHWDKVSCHTTSKCRLVQNVGKCLYWGNCLLSCGGTEIEIFRERQRLKSERCAMFPLIMGFALHQYSYDLNKVSRVIRILYCSCFI